jgi:hypothetical protein
MNVEISDVTRRFGRNQAVAGVLAAGLVLITVRGPRESPASPAPQAEPGGAPGSAAPPPAGRIR